MIDQKITIEEWLSAVVEATEELTVTTFALDGCAVHGLNVALPTPCVSASIAIIGDSSILQIGIAGTEENCQKVARLLLGMTEEDGELPKADLADALGEVANIVAGGVKGRLAERDPSLKLGLPLFVEGSVSCTDSAESASARVLIGDVEIFLVTARGAMSDGYSN